MTTIQEPNVAEFVKRIQALQPRALGSIRDRLDDSVHEIKSEEASSINNQGIEEQLAFIMTAMGPTAGARWITEILEDYENGGG